MVAPMGSMIEALIKAATEHRASDLFLGEGRLARMKVSGQLMVAGDDPIDLEEMTAFWKRCGADPEYDGDRDTSYVAHNGIRFRVNLHRHLGQLGAVLRQINTDIPDLNSLGLPAELLTGRVTAPPASSSSPAPPAPGSRPPSPPAWSGSTTTTPNISSPSRTRSNTCSNRNRACSPSARSTPTPTPSRAACAARYARRRT